MADLGDLLKGVLGSAIAAIEESESAHLQAQVTAIQALAGKTPGVDDVLKAFQAGWLPDFFAAASLEVSAQLTVTSTRERTISGSGAVGFGPIQISGSLAETVRTGSNTNLGVTVTMERQSRNKSLEYALNALTAVAPPALPSGTAPLPAGKP